MTYSNMCLQGLNLRHTGYVSSIGGVVEVLFDAHNLDTTAESLDRGHVSVQDVLKELNARLSTVSWIDRPPRKTVLM